MASASSYNSPCAACKFLRRKCLPGCIFAPFFPPEEPQKFANVHKIFGASNVTKLLNELLPHQRDDAVNSLAYEAEARVKDPVHGCVGAITFLQRQVQHLQKELDAANADLIRLACSDQQHNHHIPTALPISKVSSSAVQLQQNGVLNSLFQSNMQNVRIGIVPNPINTGLNDLNVSALPWSDSANEEYSFGDQDHIYMKEVLKNVDDKDI